MDKHYVYIVKCKDDSLYTGYAKNVEQRVAKHNKGLGAKYTKVRRPVVLVYQEVYETKSEALKREYQIKQYSRNKKLALIKEG
ncbi:MULTISPECIES: GIY-YIG nuclease family protein [Staphylococcus]|uniref:GIY-YIG nuclease family protein n=1 Tax=Staphylococcus pettenkoferi TaxID=170573 RepID=A0A1Z3U2F4_9STAP|nr:MULTISPECIES: GIY-YIG nuclease family protein [Staphylococcus]ASE37449.1 GIY-YIG nuclease family protein [Staphylococcus pettenkoferi]EHM65365.1 GIY-YIG catalytic domain protein [Staphylococcus pettenkoferi VCU012]MBX8994482.1 GIY-YIG nuclease family protein [Staphylococcus pettenkoferi]MCI2792384.1 GIY-YIG nuclease family protein [Staphylococcus pettenkoferi]MCY1567902.1 GIY-YIG nuclease family protein [Staphylococcus pettenkoferi]